MTLQQARQAIRDDHGGFSEWVFAAGVLTSCQDSSLDDLVACLKRTGLPSEMAATTLYLRTKRRRQDDTVASIILDHDDWAAYIHAHNLDLSA